MNKVFKGFLLMIAFVLLLSFFFIGGESSFAQTNNDYIKYTIKTTEEGKVSQSLIFSTTLPASIDVLKKQAFEIQLVAYLNSELASIKNEIELKYLQDSQEEFNPSENIIFGSNGSAVREDGFVGFAIEYSSMEVFKYYNNILTTYQEGFLMDKYTVAIDNPFNDVEQVDLVIMTKGEKYKNFYISAGETIGIGQYLKEYYNPYYYVDYVTLSHRAKSNSYQVLREKNLYHHYWISEGLNFIEDYEMVLTLNVIHTGWWYLLGTAIPLVIMGVAIVIVVTIKKKKSKVAEEK